MYWMKIAFGHMGYSPDQFWSFTLREWQACVKGHNEKQGIQYDDPMRRNRLKALMEKYPDGSGS